MNEPFLPMVPRRAGWAVAAVALLLALGAAPATAQTFVRLQNRWTGDYIHVENGFPESGTIREGWFSAMWVVEPVPGTEYRRLKNRYTGKYLHVENGPLQQGDIQPGWFSAMWTQEPVPGTDYYRFQNRYTGKYLHVEGGPLQVGDIQQGWFSAMWTVAPAGPCRVETLDAGPIRNDNDARSECTATCEKANGTWNNQWQKTGKRTSVCGCSIC